MRAPLRVEVELELEGEHILPGREGEDFADDFLVERTHWLARRTDKGVIVSVTAYTSLRRNRCRSWYRPSPAVGPGIDTSLPPEWIPDPPYWFLTVVDEMERAS